ncbi:MAG: glutamate racemase [Candidatus Limivicinus sp.]|jgi:glutamate racemase
MDNRPVGIFDSGLGGLTAARALRELLPEENIIYFGDTARCPYGKRTIGQIRAMARQDMELVRSFGAKAIIAACGTVSCAAEEDFKTFPVPVFSVIDPGVRAMAAVEGDGPLGIIATAASIKSGVIHGRLQALCPDREIVDAPCQNFVELIEHGHTSPEDGLVQKTVAEYLRPMKEKGVSALLLGCTHFGFLAESISRYMGEDVQLISAARCSAKSMRDYLVENSLTGKGGKDTYYTSGNRAQFCSNASRLLKEDLNEKVFAVKGLEVPPLC